jgi:hypothetical protein
MLDSHNQPNLATSPADVSLKAVKTQWSPGTPVSIIATVPREKIVALHKSEHLPRLQVSGKTYHDAQGVIVGTAQPLSDGAVRIQLTPEIQFGDPRNQFVAADGAIQLRTERNRETFPDLVVDTRLTAGQTLMLGCTAEPKGIGAVFFTEINNGEPHKKLLLLRVAGTQHDELFDSLEEPLVDN